MAEFRLSELRQLDPELAESPTLTQFMRLSDLRQPLPGDLEGTAPTSMPTPPWSRAVNQAIGTAYPPVHEALYPILVEQFYNPENPSPLVRGIGGALGYEYPQPDPNEVVLTGTARPGQKLVGDIGAKALKDAATILKLHETGGGGSTFNVATGKPVTSGYSVAVFPNKEDALKAGRYTPSEVVEGQPTLAQVSNFLADIRRQKILENKALSAGTWTNEGKTYLDITATPSQEATAANLGQKGGQKALYDITRGQERPVEPNPHPTQVRLSSIRDLEDTVAQLQGEMRPFGQAKEMYERGVQFKKSLGEKVGEPTWYLGAGNTMDLFRTPQDWDMFWRFYAATSPQQQSAAGNLDAALKAFGMWKTGATKLEDFMAINPATGDPFFMRGHAGNLARAASGELEMTGPKVFEFNRAIPSLREALARGDPEAVAFDRHNAAFYFRKLGEKELTEKHVQVGAARMREDARRVGTTPQEFAETLWRGWVVKRYGKDYPGAQALEPQIRARLAEKHSGIENISDWAATLGLTAPMALYMLGKATMGPPGTEAGAPQ